VRTNTSEEYTRGVMCIGPTVNYQGSYKFMCMRNGRRITCKQFKELPMPQSVIKRVERMAEKEKQDKTLVFAACDENKFAMGNFDARRGSRCHDPLAPPMANMGMLMA
jgi:hypothetical protein